MTEQAFQTNRIESEQSQSGQGSLDTSHATAEIDSMNPEEQLQLARELHGGNSTDQSDNFEGEEIDFSKMWDPNRIDPEQRASSIEENVVKGLRGDDTAMAQAKYQLESELRKPDGDQTFKELEEDGRYFGGERGAPHAEIEYAKDANGNDTDEIVAIEFSKFDRGLPPEYNSERIELNNPRAEAIDQEAKDIQQDRAFETHKKQLDGKYGKMGAIDALLKITEGKEPEPSKRQR